MAVQHGKRPISMTMPPKVIDYLDKVAEEKMVSRSAVAMAIILEKIDEEEKGEEK